VFSPIQGLLRGGPGSDGPRLPGLPQRILFLGNTVPNRMRASQTGIEVWEQMTAAMIASQTVIEVWRSVTNATATSLRPVIFVIT
jgi:hypothetical protein